MPRRASGWAAVPPVTKGIIVLNVVPVTVNNVNESCPAPPPPAATWYCRLAVSGVVVFA